MFKEKFYIKRYEGIYYENLNNAYFEVFKRKFLSKDEYEKRFRFEKYFSSFLILDKKSNKIIGHVGFKINNLNPLIKGRIGFRYSTFIAEDHRGSGVYQYLINHAMEELKNNFHVKFIFAWPNKINLISCLKDSKYVNLNPVITWQLNLDDFSNKDKIEKNFLCISLNKSNFNFKLPRRDNYLTNESANDLRNILFERENKKYFYITYKNMYSIIGYSILNNNKYLSVVLNNGFEINLLLKIMKNYFQEDNFIVQIWCDNNNRNLLRSLLKENFLPNGPVFFNGVYELMDDNFPKGFLLSMYNHDAF